MFKSLIILLAITFSSIALADSKVLGHLAPLPHEVMGSPVRLDCGATITEMRGGNPDVRKLNALCNQAAQGFKAFVEHRGYKLAHNMEFEWSISFIPYGKCYRCLNDTEHRFYTRTVDSPVWGITDQTHRYMFVLSDKRSREFTVTFVHELFHSMSMHYGVYNSHPGGYGEKSQADEVLAEDFTDWLGHGR